MVVNDQAQVMRVPLSSLSLPAPASVPAPTTLPTALSAVATALTENKPMPVLSDVLHPDGSCVAAGDSDAVVTEPLVTTANTVGDTPATKPPHLTRQPRNSEDFEPQPVGNLLGTGLGFGLSLGNNSSESAKADGVAVYLKRGATLILSHVVGNKVFGDNAESWEQHVAVNLKKCAVLALEQQALEKLQQLDYERSPDGGLTLSAEHVTSPKKSTRRIMFDPSSPSNASTGIFLRDKASGDVVCCNCADYFLMVCRYWSWHWVFSLPHQKKHCYSSSLQQPPSFQQIQQQQQQQQQ